MAINIDKNSGANMMDNLGNQGTLDAMQDLVSSAQTRMGKSSLNQAQAPTKITFAELRDIGAQINKTLGGIGQNVYTEA